jgi:hypothetical protein
MDINISFVFDYQTTKIAFANVIWNKKSALEEHSAMAETIYVLCFHKQ